jgi:hypothetical protein
VRLALSTVAARAQTGAKLLDRSGLAILLRQLGTYAKNSTANLYLGCSRSARPLPRGLTGHVTHPIRSIVSRLLPQRSTPTSWLDRPCHSSDSLPLISRDKRAKVGPMGHNKARDNARKRAKRRKKYERLASAKQPSRDATARQEKKAGK